MAGEHPGETPQRTGNRKARGSQAARLYALGVSLVLFFVSWSAIAARPWQDTSAGKADPRLVALSAREKQLRHQALVVERRLKRRWTIYERSLEHRRSEIAAAEQRHEQAVAAAAAAAARAAAAAAAAVAAAQNAVATRTQSQAPASPAPVPARVAGPSPVPQAPARAPAPTPKVVVVELPPITVSSGS